MFEREVVIPARAELITDREKIALPETSQCIRTRVLIKGLPKVDRVSAYWQDAEFDVNWGKAGGWFTTEGRLIPTGRIIGYWNPRAPSSPPTLHTKEELGFGKKKSPVVESRNASKRQVTFAGTAKTNERTASSAKAIATQLLGEKPSDLPDTGPAAVRPRMNLTQSERQRRADAIAQVTPLQGKALYDSVTAAARATVKSGYEALPSDSYPNRKQRIPA